MRLFKSPLISGDRQMSLLLKSVEPFQNLQYLPLVDMTPENANDI
jgi:hypothetical protein